MLWWKPNHTSRPPPRWCISWWSGGAKNDRPTGAYLMQFNRSKSVDINGNQISMTVVKVKLLICNYSNIPTNHTNLILNVYHNICYNLFMILWRRALYTITYFWEGRWRIITSRAWIASKGTWILPSNACSKYPRFTLATCLMET